MIRNGAMRQPRLPAARAALTLFRRQPLPWVFLFIDLYWTLGVQGLITFPYGVDGAVYSGAARAWLTGMDPWRVTVEGLRFAGPPPTLILYVPFAFLPTAASVALLLVADLVAIRFALRRLRLAWWWILFPPILQGLMSVNPDPIVVACLVARHPALQALGPVVKVYGLFPLAGERRVAAFVGAGLALAISAWLLPWGLFVQDLPVIASTLETQGANVSAYSVPLLLPIGLLALWRFGSRRAGWLAVPVIWPHTQLHYATISLPAMTPLIAVGFSLPIPGAPAVAVAAQALLERHRPRGRWADLELPPPASPA